MDYTVVVVASGLRPGAVQVPRPLRRLRHGPALDGERRARPHRLRRPVQAGRGLPPGVAAAAPPAGPRGLPRRRVLPAQPSARAGRQAVRRARRRFADRPAGHRDQGRRRLGLHPDQRDLDHRRPGLPPGRPVQVRCASGRRRRHLGVPRGWRRPDQGHEDRCRHAQARPRPVPRARGVRHLRLRARQGVGGPARARLPPHRAAQAGPQLADAGRGAGRRRSSPAPAATSTTSPSPTSSASRPTCSTSSAAATPTCSTRSAPPARSPTATRSRPPSPPSRTSSSRPRAARHRRGRRRRGRRRRASPGSAAPRPPARGRDRPHRGPRRSAWQVARSGSSAGRIKSVESTKKITRAMELIAATRVVKAQERAAAARPYSEQITSVILDLAAAGAAKDHPLLRDNPDANIAAFVVVTSRPRPVRRLQHHRHPHGRARDQGPPGPRAATTRLIVVGTKARAYFRFRDYRIDATFAGVTDQPDLRGRPRGRRRRARARSRPASSPRSTSPTPASSSTRHPGGRRPALPARSRSRTTTPRRRRGPSADFEFEPSPDGHPRRAPAPLRRVPHLLRPARRRRPPSTPPASGP